MIAIINHLLAPLQAPDAVLGAGWLVRRQVPGYYYVLCRVARRNARHQAPW
jgi:hypothetical protein